MPQTCHRPTVEEAAQFLCRLHGGVPSREWLTSLLYLSDRHHVLTYGHSLADDRFASLNGMPMGVGTNRVVAVMSANRCGSVWELREIEHLSVAIEDTLKTVHTAYGHKTAEELDGILRGLPEAIEAGPFPYRQLGTHLGDPDPDSLHESMETSRDLTWCFDDLRCRLQTPQAA
ncbi:Panacea domain-containing protein [Pararhizobium sp. BT-229]|uniref:Panacea domain-containing protein n=1 Tax=Pararhizobium sp. BT-229 TaxID=2986923 RepID=UPI0021F756C6|nr:Panacea domain-containing protein [Pararhizobium sp. BT-229]MCV9964594.1 Panacea domain-containing protein [Pararhizobium sp. BT-229]